jgi:uncharacterized protein
MAAIRGEQALGEQAERLGASGERTGSFEQGRPVLLVLLAYASLAGLATACSLALGRNPFACDGWLQARGPAAWLVSLGLGVLMGATTIAATRAAVRRWRWARSLHLALRPMVHGSADATLLAVAVASAAGEELLFRGLLVPLVGVAASSVVFGALHQVRGRARWPWMAWATVMGILFATVFAATGSLLGPLVAHAAINHWNLRFLRDTGPAPKRTPLGGLLRR